MSETATEASPATLGSETAWEAFCAAGLWTGLVFPAGVSPAIVARLNAEMNAVIKDPEVIKLLLKQGVATESGGPDVLAARIKGDLAKWRDLVAKAGIRAQ